MATPTLQSLKAPNYRTIFNFPPFIIYILIISRSCWFYLQKISKNRPLFRSALLPPPQVPPWSKQQIPIASYLVPLLPSCPVCSVPTTAAGAIQYATLCHSATQYLPCTSFLTQSKTNTNRHSFITDLVS